MVTCAVVPRQAAARGDDIKARAAAMSDEAAALFAAKSYLEAAERFEQAYALDTAIIVRLRNAGRAWEEAGRSERALHCFERYLVLERDEALRRDAEERIARHRAILAKARAAASAGGGVGNGPSGVASAGADEAAGGDVASAPSAGAEGGAVVAQAPPGGRALTIATTVAAAALVAGGVIWHLETGSAAGRVDDGEREGQYAYPGGDAKLADDRDTVSTNRAVAWSLVGAGAVAGGYALYRWLAADPGAAAEATTAGVTSLRLLPSVHPRGAALMLSAAF